MYDIPLFDFAALDAEPTATAPAGLPEGFTLGWHHPDDFENPPRLPSARARRDSRFPARHADGAGQKVNGEVPDAGRDIPRPRPGRLRDFENIAHENARKWAKTKVVGSPRGCLGRVLWTPWTRRVDVPCVPGRLEASQRVHEPGWRPRRTSALTGAETVITKATATPISSATRAT